MSVRWPFKLMSAVILAFVMLCCFFLWPHGTGSSRHWPWQRPEPPIYKRARKIFAELEEASKKGDLRTMVSLLGTDLPLGFGGEERFVPDIVVERLLAAGPAGIDAVVKWGTTNQNENVRAMSLEILGRTGDTKYVPVIERVLSNESRPCVLVLGASALCRLGRTKEAAPLIQKCLPITVEYIAIDGEEWTIHEMALRIAKQYHLPGISGADD